jgi:hypothetical protein
MVSIVQISSFQRFIHSFSQRAHRKRLSMARINCVDSISFQFLGTGIRFHWVVDNGVEFWFVRINKQITAKQVATGRQNPN